MYCNVCIKQAGFMIGEVLSRNRVFDMLRLTE